MIRRTVFLAACLALGVGLFTPAQAFDGNRKGFILGFGLGLGSSSVDQTVSAGFESASGSDSFTGLQTAFRIGGAPSEQVAIYYFNDVSWFSMENALGSDVTVASGVGGAGVTYYLAPTSPSFYFGAGIGLGTWMLPFESDSDIWSGFGLGGLAGYEFARHWSVEVMVNYGEPGKTEFGVEVTSKVTTFKAAIAVLAF